MVLCLSHTGLRSFLPRTIDGNIDSDRMTDASRVTQLPLLLRDWICCISGFSASVHIYCVYTGPHLYTSTKRGTQQPTGVSFTRVCMHIFVGLTMKTFKTHYVVMLFLDSSMGNLSSLNFKTYPVTNILKVFKY